MLAEHTVSSAHFAQNEYEALWQFGHVLSNYALQTSKLPVRNDGKSKAAVLRNTFLAYFTKMEVGLSNHQSVCLSPTNNF
jgi:hypothetical protein